VEKPKSRTKADKMENLPEIPDQTHQEDPPKETEADQLLQVIEEMSSMLEI